MSNSLNLPNIKNLLAAAYLSGVKDAFEKSKGLDTYSLQKNIEDSAQFREILLNQLKENNIENPESILITAKTKAKELFCEKYPDEMKCKATPPTNKNNNSQNNSQDTGIISSISSFFTPKVNSSVNTNTSSVNTNSRLINNSKKNIPPPSLATVVNIQPPSVATVVNIPPPSVATIVTPNASAVNPMVQSQPPASIGGKRKSK
jgi:hypothetical protein